MTGFWMRLRDGRLIKRPFLLQDDGQVLVGFKADVWAQQLKAEVQAVEFADQFSNIALIAKLLEACSFPLFQQGGQ